MANSEREERYVKAFKGVRSTGGAVPVMNDRGEISMEKVKVTRHRAGYRPAYAADEDSDSSDGDDEEQTLNSIVEKERQQQQRAEAGDLIDAADPRLARLQQAQGSGDGRGRQREVIEAVVEEDESEDEDEEVTHRRGGGRKAESSDEEDADSDEEESEHGTRRERMLAKARERAKVQATVEDELDIEDDEGKEEGAGAGDDDDEDESGSEWETDSEEEDDAPMFKPVFVAKSQRTTQLDREAREAAEAEAQEKAEKVIEDKKQRSRVMLERKMQEELNAQNQAILGEHDIDDDDDNVNEEEEFEAWKVRELKRIKREQDKRATEEAERLEIERLRDMTEEERQAALAAREKKITNKQDKGKMKFMQKYYHRGAFFMDQEEEVYKRDITGATLEDHFDKSVMPEVMQVKNFGKVGRTKYTHLADQDTSAKDSLWSQGANFNQKLETNRAGAKPVFERPSSKRKRT